MEKANQLCLSDEELLSEIKYYIESKFYNYAVMIDGAWGSGKTYFVNQVLLPELKKEKKIMSVPAMLIDGEQMIFGSKTMTEIIEALA